MGHVQERASGIALDTHVFRLGQTDQGSKSTGAGNLGLVFFMGSQVGDTPDRIALNLNIGRYHLVNQRRQPSQGDNQHLVIGYMLSVTDATREKRDIKNGPLTARFPRAALAARWTSISGLWSKDRMGSKVSRSTSRTSVYPPKPVSEFRRV